MKLYRQFGHCGFDRLKQLIQGSGVFFDDESLTTCIQEWEIRLKRDWLAPKPALSTLLFNPFNGVVALDLHNLGPGKYHFT